MDHSYVEKNEVIEKYLLHELSDKEESDFEQHLLFCEKCREELDTMLKIRAVAGKGIMQTSLRKEKQGNAKVSGIRYFYKYAAACIILIGLGFLLTRILSDKNRAHIAVINNGMDTANVDTLKKIQDISHQDSAYLAEDKENKKPESINNELLAQAFEPSPFFEGLIDVQYRAPSVEVISPRPDQSYSVQNIVLFRWSSSEYDSLQLVLFNNKEEQILEKHIGKSYRIEQKLKPGLYYWQLENKKEALHVGKIIIKEGK